MLLSCLAVPSSASGAEPEVVRRTTVAERMVDLEIRSPALGTTAPVRILLPEKWDEQPSRTWPVLYLLHGCCTPVDYRSWTEWTDVEQFTADKDVLVVMPSDGPAGMYSQWWNQGRTPLPDWESFHLDEVREVLERDYRAGQRRAVAGLSIGGYGAMAYAFRRRGMFDAAASYSGAVDILQGSTPTGIQSILISQNLGPFDLWGQEHANRLMWMAHNPADNAEDLRGVELYVSCGNGEPGPLDPPGQEYEAHEKSSLDSSRSFTDRLRQHGVPVTTNYYGNGTHAWEYWERELHASWPLLARGMGLVP
ncbi:alpha/beta hydrolase family protein [Saccharopolyspora taberi]|uniref:Alpha/beta hydrolase family protein n=1 Tax=Saccharopolyspora taberi TaxID=60895 RepID=A0ABN3V9J5_9PSEU